MAITIKQTPALFTPVYNPVVFTLESTNTAQDNFRYIYDVYVSGVSASYIFRGEMDADPNNGGRCAIDVGRILENYITNDISNNAYGFQLASNSAKAYEVKFGEQYGPSSGITNYPNLKFSGIYYVLNAVKSPYDFKSWTGTPYYSPGQNLLTVAPASQIVRASTSNRYLPALNNSSGDIYFLQVETFDSNSVAIQTAKIENSYQAATNVQQKRLYINVGGNGLNNATLYSGTQPVIDSNVAWYRVKYIKFDGTTSSQAKRYDIDTRCTTSDVFTLHFLNELGAFDSYDFIRKSHIFSDIKRDRFERKLGELSTSTWSYGYTDRGTVTYNTSITDRYQIESDWLSDSEFEWLRELVESPEVYYDNETQLQPVDILATSFETKKIDNEKLNNLRIEFTLSQKRWRQRG